MKRKKLPLKGKFIVITRSVGGSHSWQEYFKRLGATLYCFPTIEIVPIKSNPTLTMALEHISDFDWVVATSIEGLRTIATRPRGTSSLAVLGGEAEKIARAMGYQNIFRPSTATSTALARELKVSKRSSVLFLRSTIASRVIPKILTARGARVMDLPAYRTATLKNPDRRFSKILEKGVVDYITFASPSAVRGFSHRLEKKFHKKALDLPTIAIGPSVAKALKKAGFRHIRIASEPTAKGMADAMI
jgi:uroporphyrinogen-III synthase